MRLLETRLFEPGDEELIVKLLEDVFEGWPKFDLQCSPLDHWKWKFLDAPKGALIFITMDSGQIIQTRHVILKDIKVGNNVYKSGIGADLALREEYRGTGAYRQLREFKDGVEDPLNMKFRTFIQGNPKLIARDKQEGRPEFPHRVRESVRIIDPSLHFGRKNQTINTLAFKSIAAFTRARKTINPITEDTEDITVKQVKLFDERVNSLCIGALEHSRFMIVRDRDYLNWRYCDPRGGEYSVYIAEKDEDIIGYMVLRINQYYEDYPTGYLVDLLVDPEYLNAYLPLLDAQKEFFEASDINYVKTWSIDNRNSKYLLNVGFVPKPEKIHLMINEKTLEEESYNVLKSADSSQIHFALGDHDHI